MRLVFELMGYHPIMHLIHLMRESCIVALLGSALLMTPLSAQRAIPGGLQFRFMGPAVGNRISAAAGSRAIRRPITRARHRAASGRPPTAACVGPRSSTASRHGDRRAGASRRSDPKIGVGRHRRSVGHPRQRHDGRRHLQVDRRRQDLDAHGARRDRPHRPHHRSTRPIPTSCSSARPGRLTGPQQERGVFRTTDGGETLGARAVRRREHRLLRPVDGCRRTRTRWSPARGKWRCTPRAMFSGGPGSGVYVSHDGGAKWKRSRGPRAAEIAGRQDRRRDRGQRIRSRVYALIQTADQGSVWRSDDGGENWRVVNW